MDCGDRDGGKGYSKEATPVIQTRGPGSLGQNNNRVCFKKSSDSRLLIRSDFLTDDTLKAWGKEAMNEL